MRRVRPNQYDPVRDDGVRLAEYDYHEDGTVRRVENGPIQQSYTYDLDKNLVGLRIEAGGSLLAENRYAYDGNGNRTWRQQLEGETRYGYDSLNQLVRVEYPKGKEGDPTKEYESATGRDPLTPEKAGVDSSTTKNKSAYDTPIDTGKSMPPNKPTPNSIYEQINPDNTVKSRTFYDQNGNQFSRQDFDHPHFDKKTKQYYQPHEHNYKYNDNGLPTGKSDGPLPSGYSNTPTK